MQSIFHHNSSENRAFAVNLKNKEVHSAITLHPIKRTPLMYRLFAYHLGLSAQKLRQESLYLRGKLLITHFFRIILLINVQRAGDIQQMISLLQIPKTHKMLARGVSLFPENDNDSFNFVGDHDMLGKSLWFFVLMKSNTKTKND